jgi:hypothetical protein
VISIGGLADEIDILPTASKVVPPYAIVDTVAVYAAICYSL